MINVLLPFFRKSLIILLWVFAIFSVLFSKKIETKEEKNEKTLTIFTWSSVFPNQVIKNFEKKTGIRVKIDYYSSNEELLMKLKKVGSSGYDLIVPSDYAVPLLKKENLLQEIDHTRLNFINDLNSIVTHHDYDPNNTYSLPLQWDICGFGIDTEIFKNHHEMNFTWDHLFDPSMIDYKIAMTNDPVEAFSLASYYLFGKKSDLTKEEASKVKDLLLLQKKYVEAYAAPRSDYILGSKNASLALSLSAYILRSKSDFPFMKFVLPEKCAPISIENISIPKETTKHKQIYQFINYIYETEAMTQSCNDFGVFPATLSAKKDLKYAKEFEEIEAKINSSDYELFFCKHLISEKDLKALWIKIKS